MANSDVRGLVMLEVADGCCDDDCCDDCCEEGCCETSTAGERHTV